MNATTTRQIILDTETTGINRTNPPYKGHRIIEIGAVEMINRCLTDNNFHVYLRPDRLVEPEAFIVHGISDEFLLNYPTFSDIENSFFNYIRGAELIIHNASFDIGFINYEFEKSNRGIPKVDTFCKVTDTLEMSRKMFPGKRNNLNALCSRYKIDNSRRSLHGALLDAQILAEIYLNLTSGQTLIPFEIENNNREKRAFNIPFTNTPKKLRVTFADNKEISFHNSYLDFIQKKSGRCLWKKFS